ncbi:MAG TPA: hypothetical protein DCS87_16425 [Rheinheimera sp.]|nr:hypothetical protein [Rheinheimera sp.]
MVVLVLLAVVFDLLTNLAKQIVVISCCIGWSAASHAANASSQLVRYAGDARVDYYVELMQLALSYPKGQGYQLAASGLNIPKQRAFDLMNAHQGIDIMFGSASKERLANYRAVPFSILRGLNGYRVALVAADKQHQFKSLHSLQRLETYRAGQLASWSDRTILEANQLMVETTDQADNLFLMLEKGRIDYFPLAVVEARQELEKRPQLHLTIDPYILLYYPTATYFYVAKDNPALADALLDGLKQALADGRFDTLFAKYFAKDIEALQLEQRRVFRLHNPLLPPEVDADGPETWPLLSNPVSDLTDER